jgi:hypothetical protein
VKLFQKELRSKSVPIFHTALLKQMTVVAWGSVNFLSHIWIASRDPEYHGCKKKKKDGTRLIYDCCYKNRKRKAVILQLY